MMGKKYAVFDLYEMEMWGNREDGWEENNRFHLGKLHVPMTSDGGVCETDILKAMRKKQIKSLFGGVCFALSTRNRRVVYIEDYSGDGTWYEIGTVKHRKPIYGLKFVEEVMK